ncbi:MAG: hypothetical protein HQM16_12175 [Deltaproteobacteria bacterium]|nr:hypothetical protein [Deltaproteobacteria bacterium]
MKCYKIKANRTFIGRTLERERLLAITKSATASIVVVYGRRRVGKTALIEQVLGGRNLLKFEGIEGQPEARQRRHFLLQLSEYAGDPMIAKLRLSTWTEVFQTLFKYTSKGVWTLFFDEVQWLAAYKTRLIAELKFVWDNSFKQNQSLILVLCGSSPSFIIKKILRSKALYNRSQYEIPLQEFPLVDTKSFLKSARSAREVMDATLTVGGIPEYLKYLDGGSSVFLGLCQHAFTQGGFFTNEYQRIFSSSLGDNPDYMKVICFLSRRPHVTRREIAKHLRTSSGGRLTNLLHDLELCGFVTKYTPFQLKQDSLISRYVISDQYLQFYFRFIAPLHAEIQDGQFDHNPAKPLNSDAYDQWLAYSFERYCRKHHHIIAKLLNFGAVSYRSGAFFNRETEKLSKGFQIDLVFERKDKVHTVCEIKYSRVPVTKSIIVEFEKKLALFPKKTSFTLEKVLITAEGVDSAVKREGYFDSVITLDDIFAVGCSAV